MIGRALAVWAVLIAAAGLAGWGLAGLAGRVHERAEARKGNATASGSPGRNGGRRG